MFLTYWNSGSQLDLMLPLWCLDGLLRPHLGEEMAMPSELQGTEEVSN